MNTTTQVRTNPDVHSTVTDHVVVITFRAKDKFLYTLVGDASGDDFFVDHLTGKHITYDPQEGSKFMALTEEFAERELWDV